MKEKILKISFSEIPDIRLRVIKKNDSKYLRNNKIKYPFELFNFVEVTVKTDKREIKFVIFKGYKWNGADIPRFFWFGIGSRTDNEFLTASMVHDYLLEFRVYILKDILNNKITTSEYRRLTSLIFGYILKEQGTWVIKANVMSWGVQIYQTLFCRKAWDI